LGFVEQQGVFVQSLMTKHQTPNTKHQIIFKLQLAKHANWFGSEFLKFGSWWFFGVWCLVFGVLPLHAALHTYVEVDSIFSAHCLDCHESKDPEANLVLESFESLMKGGEAGAAIIPGKSAESLLVRMIEGKVTKDGKTLIMPPGKRKKLSADEIAAIKSWIDDGAKPLANARPKELIVPKIELRGTPRQAIDSLAFSATAKLIAVGKYAEVELRNADDFKLVRKLTGHRGNVNAVLFSADGSQLFAAAGEPSVIGEVRQWNVADGKLMRVIEGHKDALYCAALSPDGETLATAGYDQKIKLWKVADGSEIKTLSGHNGCVYGLAFRPDGKILASASADRTVKLWDVASGQRRDTLSQPLKDQFAVAFSADGKRLLGGGVDNRIRVWEVSENATETTNPILESKFAHEGAILKLVFSSDGKTLLSSADDRTVKLWAFPEMKELFLLERQPDWPPALAFGADDKKVYVGRLDGTIGIYETSTGKLISSIADGIISKIAGK
jgi:WD40 repeat protein